MLECFTAIRNYDGVSYLFKWIHVHYVLLDEKKQILNSMYNVVPVL